MFCFCVKILGNTCRKQYKFQLSSFTLMFSTYPAKILKLYIQDVLAALKTLHQTRWCLRSTKYSQEFGLCKVSLPILSKPSVWQALFKCSLRRVSRLWTNVILWYSFRPNESESLSPLKTYLRVRMLKFNTKIWFIVTINKLAKNLHKISFHN